MKEKIKVAGIFIMVITCLFFIIRDQYYQYKYKFNFRYSIGKIIDVDVVRHHYSVYYQFKVDTTLFFNWDSKKEYNKERIGKWFYVKYYPKKPSYISDILDIPVKDTLMIIPSQGLKEIPSSPEAVEE